MVTTVSDVCNVSNVQLHVLIKKKIIIKKKLYYSTIFHQIRSRERAKYKTVIHCTVPV